MSNQLSYVSGVSSEPLLYETIGARLSRAAKDFPLHEAVVSVHQNVRLTYTELNEMAEKIGSGLLAMGIKPHERVGIWAPNCVEWMLAQYATAKAGIILVNINPAYRIAELEYVLNKVECAGLIFTRKFKSSDYLGMVKEISPNLFNLKGENRAPSLRLAVMIDDGDPSDGVPLFSEIESNRTPESDSVIHNNASVSQPEDAINIQFTSGTTGAPKGATLSHHNILNNGHFVGEGINITDQDRICVPVPLYHCFGMVMGNLAALTHGACVIYPSSGFEAAATLQAIGSERCTALYGVPTMFIGCLADETFKNSNFDSLRTGIMAGSPCPIAVMKRVVNEMQIEEISICYGMTETSPVSFQSSVDDPLEKRVTTVGRIHPHLEVKVIDENNRVVPRGEQGEICTRGYSVMKGYWGDEANTRNSIDANHWMHTGDLGVISEDGYANITGRAKDVIIRGGENIYPKEIENNIMRHEAVQDVQVFGIPDQKFGEVSAAWIVLESGASESIEGVEKWLRTQIAHYKIPKYFKRVDAFPMTVSGKAQKYVMRESMIAEHKLSEIDTA